MLIRNADGRASDDDIRSLIISYKLLGTKKWFVIHHTDCGMETFTNDIIRHLLYNSLGWVKFEICRKVPGTREGEFIEFLPIHNLKLSVIDDVERIRSHPLIPDTFRSMDLFMT